MTPHEEDDVREFRRNLGSKWWVGWQWEDSAVGRTSVGIAVLAFWIIALIVGVMIDKAYVHWLMKD